MRLRLYRLAFPDQSLARMARQMRDLLRGGRVDTRHLRPCIAYESAELAAMCSPELLWNVRRKTELLRETLTFPADAGPHEMAPHDLCAPFEAGTAPEDALMSLVEHMLRRNLLTLWIPSFYEDSQHAVFVNPCHEAFPAIAVLRRQLVLTRPSWSGNMHVPDRLLLLAGAEAAEPSVRYTAAPQIVEPPRSPSTRESGTPIPQESWGSARLTPASLV